MSAAHPDEVLRQRNQYREELANARREQDSLHALVTSLRNNYDQLESENVDLRKNIEDLQKSANTRSQERQVC
jgi:chromosome segregation ATPase